MTDRIRLVKTSGADRVDFEKKVIYGASAAQAVEALGHNLMLDQVSLSQIADLGNRGLSLSGRKRDGIKVRFTHPGMSADGFGKALGRGKNFRVEGDKTLFDIHLIDAAFQSGLEGGVSLGDYVMDLAHKDPDMFGMSMVFRGRPVWTFPDGTEREAGDRYEERPEGALTAVPVVRVDELNAIDAVDEPAANRHGMFGEFNDASAFLWATNQDAEAAFGDIDDMLLRWGVSPAKAKEFALRYLAARELPLEANQGVTQRERVVEMDEDELKAKVFVADSVNTSTAVPNGETWASNSFTVAPGMGLSGLTVSENFVLTPKVVPDPVAELRQEIAELRHAQVVGNVRMKLMQSGLTPESQGAVATAFDMGMSADAVDGMIARQRQLEAKFREPSVIEGIRPIEGVRIGGMMSDLDRFTAAFEAMLQGTRPAQGIRPLSGIREAYMQLSGDYELTGVYRAENVAFANVTTVTMPLIMANVMNKQVVSMFNEYDRWWEQIVVTDDAANMQDLRWHKIGGIGEMPAVQEGAAYTETTWAEDYETAGWIKKGHYLGLTIEAIDKDDTRRLITAPRALAQSAYLTLSKDVSRLFTMNSGVGPVMRDTNPWFHASHGNIGTAAFSLASLDSVNVAMRKQKELGTGERLAGGLTRPWKYLIPLELETFAVELMASQNYPNEGATTAFEKQNTQAQGDTRSAREAAARSRLIVMDYWSDVNDWAAIADPAKFPSIGLGFRFGREPELFSVADPNSGLMFTNDTMPIKVRWFYSLGIIDARGVFKNNVP